MKKKWTFNQNILHILCWFTVSSSHLKQPLVQDYFVVCFVKLYSFERASRFCIEIEALKTVFERLSWPLWLMYAMYVEKLRKKYNMKAMKAMITYQQEHDSQHLQYGRTCSIFTPSWSPWVSAFTPPLPLLANLRLKTATQFNLKIVVWCLFFLWDYTILYKHFFLCKTGVHRSF